MANERTLMSYFRSAMAVIGLAAFVFKFYPHWGYKAFAVFCLALGLVIAYFGIRRFIRQRKKIERLQK
jgi:uncharacterized membrane protein YidH (DUF202 family)